MVLVTRRTKVPVDQRINLFLSVIFLYISAVSGTFGPYYFDVLPLEKCPTGSWAKSRCGGDFGDCMPGYACLPPNSIHLHPGILPGICCPQIQTCPIGTEPGPLCGSKMTALCPIGFDCFNGVCCRSPVMRCPTKGKPVGICGDGLLCKPGFFCYKGTCCSKPKPKPVCPPTYYPLGGLSCKRHINCPGKAICFNFQCCLHKKPLKKIKIPKKTPPIKKPPLKPLRPHGKKDPPTKPRLPPDKPPAPTIRDIQPPEKVPVPIQKPRPRLPPSPPETVARMLTPPTEKPHPPVNPYPPNMTKIKTLLPPSCPTGYQHLGGLTCDHILSCPGTSRCISGVCCTTTDTGGICPRRYKRVEGINCNLRQRCPSNSYCVSGVCCLQEYVPTCPPSYVHLKHLSCDLGTCTGNGECIGGLCCESEGIPVTVGQPMFNPTTLPTLSRFDAIPQPPPISPPSTKFPELPPVATPTTWTKPFTLPPLFLKTPSTGAPPVIVPIITNTTLPSHHPSPPPTSVTTPPLPLSPVYIPWDPLPTPPAPTPATSKPFTYPPTTGTPFVPTFIPRSLFIPTFPPTVQPTNPPITLPRNTYPVISDIVLNTTNTPSTEIPLFQVNDPLPFIEPIIGPPVTNSFFITNTMPTTAPPLHVTSEIMPSIQPTYIPTPATNPVRTVTFPPIPVKSPNNPASFPTDPVTNPKEVATTAPNPVTDPIQTVTLPYIPTTRPIKTVTLPPTTVVYPIETATFSPIPMDPFTFPRIKQTEPTPILPIFPTFPSFTVKGTVAPPTRPYTFLPNIPPSIFPTFPPMKSSPNPPYHLTTTATALKTDPTQTVPPLYHPIFSTDKSSTIHTTQPVPKSTANIVFQNFTYSQAPLTMQFENHSTSSAATIKVDFSSSHLPTSGVDTTTPHTLSTIPPFIRTNWYPSTPTFTKPNRNLHSPFPYQSQPPRPTLPPIAMTFPPDPPTTTNIRVITTTMRTRFIGTSTQRPPNVTLPIQSPMTSSRFTPPPTPQVPMVKSIALKCPPGNVSIPGLTCDGVYKCPAGSNCYNSICCLSVERIQVPACPIDFLSLDPCPNPPNPDLCTMDQDCGPFMICCLTSCDQRVCRPMVAPQQIIPR